MFLPEAVDRIQHDVTLHLLQSLGILVLALQLVRLLDLLDQSVADLVGVPALEVGGLLRHSQREGDIYPIEERFWVLLVVWWEERDYLVRNRLIDDFVNQRSWIIGVD